MAAPCRSGKLRFDTIAIVGVGLIGGSIGMAVRKRGLARRVVGISRRDATLKQAKRAGAIDVGSTNLARGVADAELVVLATPVDWIARHACEAASNCPAGAILTDTGSTKARIVERLDATLPARVRFVGGHPLAGSEKGGVDQARPDLFDGCVCVLTPTPKTAEAPLETIERLWRALGARVVEMPPELHDRALAFTSHLPHLAAAALMLALPDRFHEVVASGFRDTTRIAASDPGLWSAIFVENAGPLLDALASYEHVLHEFRAALQHKAPHHLHELWTRSKRSRDALAAGANGDAAPMKQARTASKTRRARRST